MAGRHPDADIDRLYQVPLAEFTAARNALAKSGGADIKALGKPTVPAWAVNQLYWRARKTYDALVQAAESQRRTHKAVLAGRAGDLRASGKDHDQAVERAMKATLALLAGDGHPVTDATRQAILTTLRALPSGDPPGRLTQALQPGGFEMLAGLDVSGKPSRAVTAARGRPGPPAPASTAKKAAGATTAARAKAVARAKAQVEEASRKLKQAEHAARREEFESARATREADKAERRAVEARQAFEAAREALEEAEAEIPAALRARDAASRRAGEASATLDTARAVLDDAQDRLSKL